ncbi:DUF2339 domain-containing protein [Rossellomorea vietnamensis]|uniref:DUF2339 domain-containing protein n=1 Tax=Rossellomorea vietnamensis TaxID=218284 RepID=A0A5D4M2Q2_9BACI|nr:DUF2339 domain-containing protein [Rossellomorea vietnamensis]TYR95926.1 DUF2339 domain-containing protein [Rossellomorea vietnamensis]
MTLEKKVEELEIRVIELERQIDVLKLRTSSHSAASKPFNHTDSKPKIEKRNQKPLIPSKKTVADPVGPKTEDKTVDYEKLIGQVWLPRVFILVLILGVLWGYKAMVDIGLITEPIRILLGYALAGFFVWVGERQVKKGRNALGQILIGGSIPILILTTFAGNVLYGIIPGVPAFLLNVSWVVLGIYLSDRHGSQPVAVLSSIAGFLVPFLVEGTSTNILLFTGYEVLFFITLLFYAMYKNYRWLYLTSFILLHPALFVYAVTQEGDFRIIVLGIIVQHVFLLGMFVTKEIYPILQRATLFTSFIVTQGWVVLWLKDSDYTLFLVMSSAVYLSLSYWQRGADKLHTLLPVATYSLALLLADLLNYEDVGALLVIQGVIALYAGLATQGRIQSLLALLLYFIGLTAIITDPIYDVFSYQTAAWIILILSGWGLKFTLKRNHVFFEKFLDFKMTMRILFGAMAVLILAFITQLGLAATEGYSSDVQSLIISGLWVSYSIIGVIIGVKREDKKIRLLGIVLIFLTLVKVIFIDIAYISILVRAVLFIALGGVGIVLSRFYYKKSE